MKLNEINIKSKNEALVSLINDFSQVLPIDTNFIIPPDRSKTIRGVKPIPFNVFEKVWLKPLLITFPYLAIHEAVHKEIQSNSVLTYVNNLIYGTPAGLLLLKDSDLTEQEEAIRNTIEQKISVRTNYDPVQDNKEDRGEVKSLAYIATKSLLYFCSHDSNAIRLIEHAEKLETSLDGVSALRTYEIIYYLLKMKMAEREQLRFLYKYWYYSSPTDKKKNLSWNDFTSHMDNMYDKDIKDSDNKPTAYIV